MSIPKTFKKLSVEIFFLSLLLFNSCQTFDDLQFDNLALREEIEELTQRLNVFTEEIVEQQRIIDELSNQVNENSETVTENSESLQDAVSALNEFEDNLDTVSDYIGEMIENSGDLEGDLNHLLNQVEQIDNVIAQVNNTIVNIEGSLHAHEDTDNDGVNNNLDQDDDNDGTPDTQDAFPEDPNETIDTDSDGIGNNADLDDDDDGISDIQEQIDGTNTLDADTDNDGISDQEEQQQGTDPLVNNTPGINNDPNQDPLICTDCPQKIPGRDIFVVGTSESGGGVYWVNGQKNAINPDAFASDVTVSNGKIFVCGYTYGDGANYWEINGQNITQFDLPGYEGEAYSIAVHDGSIYVGGYYSYADGISGAYSCYWKSELDGSSNGVRYQSDTYGDQISFGLAVKDNGDVIQAGNYYNEHYVIPTYWINNIRSNLPRGGVTDAEAVTVQIRSSDGKLVFGGNQTSNGKPAYWVGGVKTACRIGPGDQQSGVHGLALDGNNVYQAGWTMNMVGQYPTYWKNKNKFILQGATVNGRLWDEGKATDIAIVDGKVVVVGMLTGDFLYNENGVPYDFGDGPEINNDTGYPCIWIDGTPHVLDTTNDYEVGGLFIR